MEFDDVEPVIQVLAETSLADTVLEVLVRRSEDPDIHGSRCIASHRIHRFLLKNA